MKQIVFVFLLGFLLTNLHAQRGRVQIQNGTVVTDKGTLLRGAVDRFYYNDFAWEDLRQDITEVKNLGLNCIKMYAGGAGPDNLEDWAPYIDSLVTWTREDSLYFMITPSWWWNYGTDEEPDHRQDIDFMRRYWSFYAERYKDETHMIFEICNEPEWIDPYNPILIQMQKDAYDSIRAHAPETHILFMTYTYLTEIDSVFKVLNILDDHVDWSNASVAMHGYANGASEDIRLLNEQVQDSGYTLIITEFQSVLDHKYAGLANIRVYEEQEISYIHFLEADVIADYPEFYKSMIENSEIRWEPDFGIWPNNIIDIESYNPFECRWTAVYDEGKGWRFEHRKNDLAYVNNNDYAAYYNFNFDVAPSSFEVLCSSDTTGNEIEIHLDSLNGPVVGVCNISNTGGWDTYESFTCNITTPFDGVHNIYLVFKGQEEEYLFNVRCWYFGKTNSEAPQTPYNGTPFIIPGKIEAEEYDIGGPTISYLDSDTMNRGSEYREDEVDIETTSEGGYNLSWTTENEWLEYTINCEKDTILDLEVRVSCWESGNKFNIKLNGEKLANVYIDSIGSYQDWKILTIENITIPKGDNQILRIEILDDGFNLDWINFVPHIETTIEASFADELFKIYPNPAKSSVTINSSNRGDIFIYSIEGRLLLLQEITTDNQTLRIDQFSPGNYIVKFKTQDRIFSEKLIIQ